MDHVDTDIFREQSRNLFSICKHHSKRQQYIKAAIHQWHSIINYIDDEQTYSSQTKQTVVVCQTSTPMVRNILSDLSWQGLL